MSKWEYYHPTDGLERKEYEYCINCEWKDLTVHNFVFGTKFKWTLEELEKEIQTIENLSGIKVKYRIKE